MDIIPEPEIKESFCVMELQAAATSPVAERLYYHRILLVAQGSGALVIDERSYPVDDHTLFLIARGQVVHCAADTRLHGFTLSFGDCFWERSPASANNCKAVLFNNAADNQYQVLTSPDYEQLHTLVTALYHEYLLPAYPNKLDALAAYLKILMIKLAHVSRKELPGFDAFSRQCYHRFTELVSIQYKSLHDVASYARQLHITARSLSDCCRKYAGKGAKEIINGQLVAEAKRALQFSTLPVKEIAYEMNFSTPEQFSHFFRKETGCAPLDFRNRFVNTDR
ncbi:helix-turn-helix domain-containing protein [Taibaiella chishuiensis]|uniref:AraC family transcriptional regulator n=1 Tax=Taibaiella chishuiensis TaxID=1434707 RepID=A0A2P8D1S3_9BACT|nr:helix-turn-helix domain-containing protein [Taibaiella chishuiensis]PSK91168.1 AraC family transcriptional regulator [Taibaiella chishuiensis]